MSNSKLVNVNVPAHSGNYTKGRSGRKIEKITPHHMAGVMSAEQCGREFQKVGRGGSSNYGIGNDGRIGLYVDEADTSWCNSNWDENCKSVTIEVSNSSRGGNWKIGDKALNSLIKLMADIAKRNNLGKLVKGKNVTWHSMFYATECPGAYMLSKLDYIIAEANKINYPPKPSTSTTSTKRKVGDVVTINGVYTSSTSTKKLTPAVKKGTITRIIKGARNPYLLNNGNIGWVNDACIVGSSSSSKPKTTSTIKVGDKVKIKKGAKSYEGVRMASFVYNNTYRVDELSGNRALLDKKGLCTAFNVKDLIK